MKAISELHLELNELNWWANWSNLAWLSERTYVLTSKDFEEPLFNHAGFIRPVSSLRGAESKIRRAFEKEGTLVSYLVQRLSSYDKLRNDLIARGLKAADQMSVMKLVNPYFKRNPGVSVVAIKPAQVRSWCGTYLASFYGDTHLYEVVSKIVRKTISVQGVRFMIAKQGDSVVGALATYESDSLLGAYCVGTVPRMRGRGVASTMLDHAHRYARRRKKILILQTFLSDGVEAFYLKIGFKRVYLKDVFRGAL